MIYKKIKSDFFSQGNSSIDKSDNDEEPNDKEDEPPAKKKK